MSPDAAARRPGMRAVRVGGAGRLVAALLGGRLGGHPVVDADPVTALGFTQLLAELRGGGGSLGSSAMACSMAAHTSSGTRAQIRDRLPGDPQELGDDLLAGPALERRVAGIGEQGRAEAVDVRGGVGGRPRAPPGRSTPVTR